MRISEYQIITNQSIESFMIALVADLHGKRSKLVVDSLSNHHPDYIAIVGDVINRDNDAYPIDFFQQSASIAPTFFSLGNHERKITGEQIEKIAATGVIVLDNRWTKIDGLVFGGMTSAFVSEWRDTHRAVLHYANPKIGWLDEYEKQLGFHILLDHHPENYERITKYRNIELILSGHAHGGQIRIFNRGLYAPHQGLFPKYTSGVYDNRLVVSRGLANIKILPRIGNPIEIVYIRIKKMKRLDTQEGDI